MTLPKRFGVAPAKMAPAPAKMAPVGPLVAHINTDLPLTQAPADNNMDVDVSGHSEIEEI